MKLERLPDEQLLFAFEGIEATLAANAAEAGKASATLRNNQTRRRRAGRGRLPAHLPRVDVVLAPAATECPRCQGPLVEIGSDSAERLDVIPAQFRVLVTKRPKLACRACQGVVLQEPAPARLIAGGSPTAQAIRYALNHREGLVRFLDDGRIELDNNTVERAIRPIYLSRKNALFASGDYGGARWAAVVSLVETCELNGVDPQRYFTEVLMRLVNGWPQSKIDEFMPLCWATGDQG